MKKDMKIFVVDGNSILNRAYYGIRMLTTRDGLCTNAVYGMITMLTKQLETLNPDYCAIAFDLKAPTFRHRMYEGYKANRKGMPEELAMQLPYAKECVEALGFKIIEKVGFEADDVLGSLSKLAKNDCHAYIYTGDRDSLQLINNSVSVLLAGNTDTVVYDEESFFEKYGINVSQFVDLKALMGDSSDNIPGVAGIGEKTATKLISTYGSLDGLYKGYLDSDLTKGVKEKLTAGKDNAYLSQELARIRCDVDLGISLDDIKYNGINKPQLLDLCKALEFSALIKKLELEKAEVHNNTEIEIKMKEIEVTLANTLTGRCAISYTDGTMALKCKDVEDVYICRAPIKDFYELFNNNKELICYDCKSLYKLAGKYGFSSFDVMLGAYVVDPSGNFDLSRLVAEYLNDIYSPSVPDVCYVMELYEAIAPVIEERDQHRLMFEIEMPLACVLAEMETAGFKVDIDGLKRYSDMLGKLEKEAEERIFVFAGTEFNVNSPKQLSEVLFEKLMIPSPGKKTKTGYSTNAEVLEKLRPYHPIIEEILEYRKVAKLKSTYADGLVKAADPDGRVRTNFKQTGTATGRLSSTEPNLQNIPIRTELGRELRHYFLPENAEYVLLDADYSQIELRLLADISKDENMISAFLSGADIHTSTASKVFGVPMDMVTSEQRKRAKAVNFGIVYGIGAFSLASDLNISRAKASEYIESYLENYPGVRDYLHNVVKEAYAKGYVTTPLGRRRYIPELAGQNKNLKNFGERVAMNSPIQGSAADIIKIAMINVQRKLNEAGCDARLILQVHDELLIEAHRDCADEVAKILQTEMENAADLAVPLIAEVTVGENWYDNK